MKNTQPKIDGLLRGLFLNKSCGTYLEIYTYIHLDDACGNPNFAPRAHKLWCVCGDAKVAFFGGDRLCLNTKKITFRHKKGKYNIKAKKNQSRRRSQTVRNPLLCTEKKII